MADYKFDEAGGETAIDSSANARNATIHTNTPVTCPGMAFLQRDLTTNNLVCWKDQQNFAPFIDGIPPNTDTYKQALRYYADKAQFPIMPVYTANQADKAEAIAHGSSGTNNFSNINATLQARLYSKALRDYPSQYITPDMYRQLIEWLSWNEYINGDNRFPDNNEYFFDWDPATQTLGRSGIHHDVLGSFNWMIFQDIAGLQPRLDDQIELYPIDMGYDHFTVNNLSYHGTNVTIVWQRPGGTVYYPKAPQGYSLYVGGRRVMTVDDLAHVTWNSGTGAVSVLDGSDTKTIFSTSGSLAKATEVGLQDNPRMVDAFQKAGVDITPQTGTLPDLAMGKPATASYTTTTPASQATAPANAVDGYTISGLPVTSGAYVGTNPIWGDNGSPNAQDWLQLDLGKPTRFTEAKLYFYSNKAFGSGGSTYKEPSAYSVQYYDGIDAGRTSRPRPGARAARAQLQRGRLPGGHRPARPRAGDQGHEPEPGRGHQGDPALRHPVADAGPGHGRRHGAGDARPDAGPPPSFGSFTPGKAQDYFASTTANVISTAGDAHAERRRPELGPHRAIWSTARSSCRRPLQARARKADTQGTAYNDVGSRAQPAHAGSSRSATTR